MNKEINETSHPNSDLHNLDKGRTRHLRLRIGERTFKYDFCEKNLYSN